MLLARFVADGSVLVSVNGVETAAFPVLDEHGCHMEHDGAYETEGECHFLNQRAIATLVMTRCNFFLSGRASLEATNGEAPLSARGKITLRGRATKHEQNDIVTKDLSRQY